MTLMSILEEDINGLKKYIEYFPDFPKPGILYKDVLSLLNHSEGIKLLEKISKQIAHHLHGQIDCIAMLETRGFIFAPLIALYLNVPCIPISKKGNLPGSTIEFSYDLEYGKDTLEIQSNSIKKGQRILLIDDFLATGGMTFLILNNNIVMLGCDWNYNGTLEAASKLIQTCGGKIVHGLVLMEKCDLGGRKRLNFPMISLLSE